MARTGMSGFLFGAAGMFATMYSSPGDPSAAGPGVRRQPRHGPGLDHLVFTGGTDTRQVRHRLEAGLSFYTRDDVDCLLARGTAGSIGDRHEVRLERDQIGNCLFELGYRVVGFRRKKLEREDGLFPGKQV